MLTTILHTIRQHDLIPAGTTLVVGVSGGADSLALLHLLHRLTPYLNYQLYTATFDHQLRGQASAEDVQFVQQTATAWGIPIISGQGDVRQLARQSGLSLEAAARIARYRFLAETARQVGASRIAVAHHADDQAETVLLHLIRGTGISGLSGMSIQAAVPDAPDLTLIRPLLTVTRADIEAYCRENDLHPRQDITNDDPTYLRNHIRLHTLPHLQVLNPQISRALTQLADIAAHEDDYIQQQLQTLTQSAAVMLDTGNTSLPERVRLRRETFAQLHPALQRRLVAWGAAQVAGSNQDISYLHVVEAVELAGRGQLGALALLSAGLRLRIDYDWLVLEHRDTPLPTGNQPLLETEQEIAVTIPGSTALPGGWTLTATLSASEPAQAGLAIPENSVVSLRPPRTGDRFRPLGLDGHSQKLNRWLINRKIPRHLRSRLPLLTVNDQIAAIILGAEWTISESYAVRDTSQTIVYFAFRQI